MNNEEYNTWRFPGNNYGPDQGIDTPDMETFAQDPIASLARESCQNSIDARLEGKTAKIVFKTFDIEKKDIPQGEIIEKEIDCCMNYRQSNKKIYDTLRSMKEQINNGIIHCIRVSDYNTIGLKGINEMDESPFFLLTKGTGVSDKLGSKGGSKGIGKFASFVASSINTVFYSTLNLDGEEGYLGICKLCSRRMDNSDEKTQGIGYFGINKKNMPIQGTFKLQKDYIRETPGTDIYIIGFRQSNNWKRELITKILDSFMSAIYYNDLEVEVDDIIINKSTLKDIVDNEEYIIKKSINNIKSQFLLLDDELVFRDSLDIEDYGKVDIFLKGFNKDEADMATNECVMIRYPYMKIKSLPRISNVPCSAMCIIGDNQLNSILRDIENPQHTNWEVNRVDDDDMKSEIRHIIKTLTDTIIDYIYDKLSSSEINETDVEGASDYLPGVNDETIGTGLEEVIVEKPKIVKKIKNKVKDKIGVIANEDALSLMPDLGEHDDEGEGSPIPTGQNKGKGGDPHDSGNETGLKNGGESEQEVLKLTELGGMQYRIFVADKSKGEYVLSFKSLYTENDCELTLKYLDDSNTKYNIDITNCTINEQPLIIEDGKVKGIKIQENKQYKIKLTINLRSLYAFEVKLYANR